MVFNIFLQFFKFGLIPFFTRFAVIKSSIKEMVENSIDAGATNIIVEIRNGGISYIRVTDNKLS